MLPDGAEKLASVEPEDTVRIMSCLMCLTLLQVYALKRRSCKAHMDSPLIFEASTLDDSRSCASSSTRR